MKKHPLLFLFFISYSTLVQAETTLTLSPSLLYFDYTEFSTNNEVLDNELGWLPGLEFKFSHLLAADYSFDINSAFYYGSVDYTGKTQSGAAHVTQTDSRFLRLGARINKAVNKKIKIFSGLQLHQWNRDIQDKNNISGIDETYEWQEYSVGLSADIFKYNNHIFNADIAYLLIRNAVMEADFSRINLGAAKLDLGNATGSRLNFNWTKMAENNLHYGLSLFVELWQFARSNSKLTQGGSSSVVITEPRSETQNIGIQLNINYMF